ncbi:MAG: hypothetical protein HW410_1096 [Nitrosarchaeum sp.]|nr:hypothetical protein [Nitrosarchaeum sp.]
MNRDCNCTINDHEELLQECNWHQETNFMK